jgi:hypothetical protein
MIRRHEERLERMESHHHQLGREFDMSLNTLNGEVRGLGEGMIRLERQMQRFENKFDAFGCGHPECPRSNGNGEKG